MLYSNFKKNKVLVILISLFILLFGLRFFFFLNPGQENYNALVWGSVYQIIAWFGAICGLYLSKLWGGRKSLIGRVNLAFAFGLLAQCFGQTIYSYYFFKGGQVLYPSIGDIGFFSSVLFYIYGVFALAKASGIKVSLNSFFSKIQVLVIPLLLLLLSYWIFLKDYTIDWNTPVKTFLDFGYPLGQAFYVSIAILLVVMSRKILGGVIKKPIIFLLVALIVQYFSDFMFLYKSNNGTYVAGGAVDFMYFISYFIMAFALIHIGTTFNKIKSDGFSEVSNANSVSNSDVLDGTPVLHKIALEIIKRQERIAGQIAWEEAKNINGLIVMDQQKEQIAFVDNSSENLKKIIDHLVGKYKSLFGDLAVQVSKDAARHLIAELPGNDVPESLQ